MITQPAADQPAASPASLAGSTDSAQDTALAFFDAAYRAYQKAESASDGRIDRFYSIAGLPIRLRFAGSALLPYLTRAFAHLSIEPVSNPSLTICLWDSATTNTPMPPPPWGPKDYGQAGEIHGFTNDRIFTVFQIGVGILSLLDLARGLGVYWISSAQDIPYFESGAPLRVILHPWFSKNDIVPVHAGAVGLPSGGALLIGKGGSGKSNTALACLASKLFYASDDFCLLRTQPTLTVFSVYSTGKTAAADVQRLPFLASRISNPKRTHVEKALFFLHEHFPEKILTSFPIKAILIPRVTEKPHTTLERATPAATLASIAPSTITLAPHEARTAFQRLAGIVRQAPSYYLDLGSHPDEIPSAILELLSRT